MLLAEPLSSSKSESIDGLNNDLECPSVLRHEYHYTRWLCGTYCGVVSGVAVERSERWWCCCYLLLLRIRR